MGDMIIYLLAVFLTIPILATGLVYGISKRITGKHWKSVHRAVNWTTILYIITVSLQLSILFDRPYPGIILIVLLSLLACIVIIQWKTQTEIVFTKALKLLVRISFLLFFGLYIVLGVIGILLEVF
ncbi:DUF3397 domain-containing protein [Lentibacillus sediminis]|uniref:DUF3397 domain-containing protein n=1 Tax=Lentibacillus sediminis TaxID=1940529 RepID=UPI000C1C4993|nr:DUF3397 domain-containing protein [Lentibacillus sediminis]